VADKIPVKAIYTGSDVTSLGELASGDTINASYISNLPDDSVRANGEAFSNLNTITSNVTTTTASTKNMFMMGKISVADNVTWSIAGDGVLKII
tara:strand:- start:53 stop:334 length:282 start_codon:yes stop_codon:yes gene_type:complete